MPASIPRQPRYRHGTYMLAGRAGLDLQCTMICRIGILVLRCAALMAALGAKGNAQPTLACKVFFGHMPGRAFD